MRRQPPHPTREPPNLPAAANALSNERKECMFCLEEEFGRKKYLTIWYSQLYPCECRFASHWQCLTKWQVVCKDELQCPICKVYSEDPLDEGLVEIELMPDTSRVYPPVEISMNPKVKICMFLYLCFILWIFLYGYVRLFIV